MDKNDILDYVTETPWNTNRAVLGGMLDSFAGGGGGGGSSAFVVTFTYDSEHETFTADKTFAEIESAFEGGQHIDAFEDTGSVISQYVLSSVIINEGSITKFNFDSIVPNVSNGSIESLDYTHFSIESDDAITFIDGYVSFS